MFYLHANKSFASLFGFVLSLIVFLMAFASLVSASPVCSITGFAPSRTYNISSFDAFSVTTGDFNGDNRPDIAAGGGGFGRIAVFLNDGAGGFAPPTLYQVNNANHPDITTGDFNNDGKLDIAAVNNNLEGTVTVLLGTGTGTFGSPIISSSGGKGPYYLDEGDFNNDGKLDLAVSNTFDTTGPERNISILLGDGAGSFTVSSTNPPTHFMRVADFNLDGKMDVLAVGNPLITIRWGNGLGGLTAPSPINPSGALDFTIADLNHDTKPDIAAIYNSSVYVYLGNGDGTFSTPIPYFVNADGGSFVEHGDVNGDGHFDLIATAFDPSPNIVGRVVVLLGTGTGAFTAAPIYLFETQRPFRLAVADLNGDGRADIVTQNLSSPRISVLLRTCLSQSPRYDFDGDGHSDISVYRPQSGTWYALKSTDNSLLGGHWGISTDKPVAGDYDGDGRADFAVYRPSLGAWFILRSSDFTFVAQQWGISTDQPVPADYDGDGKTDLAVYRSGAWYILKSSDGSIISQYFGLSTDTPLPADYDGDGRADICVYRPTQRGWYIQQSANNQLRTQVFGASGDVPLTGDYDGDGKWDLAVYRAATGTWYAQASATNSIRAQAWGASTDTPVPADYDGDGKTDYAIYRPSEGMWYILRSSDNSFLAQPFGLSTDIALPASHLAP